ncbi:putative dynamin, putative,vacuolar sortin protein 1 [Trypanosoma theileri]|uniref:Putative dynamin, putative,vacuolar sortin protein 1 n=1 Tax=Trypanosoma theileri TaxID=67003 RepID=A0A1X0P021_9TRYP|nr:putative dynamin, putative,vacuolar sortin protein 1 [Trypanosoma theileri]ORC90294.1 putative dynamin, putative,vacuolar sortin protein 1 [Trypanosoma theileri]
MMEELAQRAFIKVFGSDPEKKDQQQTYCSPDGKDRGENNKKGIFEALLSNGERKNMEDVPSTIMLGNNMSLHERHINDAIREMVEGYFTIVKGTVADQVPKAITLLMITKLREEVYARLVKQLYTDQNIHDLLAESPEVATQRKATTTMMEALKKAQAALENVRGFTLLTK